MTLSDVQRRPFYRLVPFPSLFSS